MASSMASSTSSYSVTEDEVAQLARCTDQAEFLYLFKKILQLKSSDLSAVFDAQTKPPINGIDVRRIPDQMVPTIFQEFQIDWSANRVQAKTYQLLQLESKVYLVRYLVVVESILPMIAKIGIPLLT